MHGRKSPFHIGIARSARFARDVSAVMPLDMRPSVDQRPPFQPAPFPSCCGMGNASWEMQAGKCELGNANWEMRAARGESRGCFRQDCTRRSECLPAEGPFKKSHKMARGSNTTMKAVPFSLDVYGGFGECNGLLKNDKQGLSLEFQTRDAVAGIVKSDVKQVAIPFHELVSVTMTKGWLGMNWMGVKLIIQTSNLKTLQAVPGMSQGRLELSIAKKDIEEAEDFLDALYGSGKAPF